MSIHNQSYRRLVNVDNVLKTIVNHTSELTGHTDLLETSLGALQTLNQNITDTSSFLPNIDINATDIKNNTNTTRVRKGYASFETDASLLTADSSPAFTIHPVLKGWRYSKSAMPGASNLYFYGNDGTQEISSLSPNRLNAIFVKCKVLNLSATSSLPFIALYTRRKNDGTDELPLPTFYRSRLVFRPSSYTTVGEDIVLHVNFKNDSEGQLDKDIYKDTEIISTSEVLSSVGNELDYENDEILFLSVNTDSDPTANVDVVYNSVGYKYDGFRYNIIELSNFREDKMVDIILHLRLLGDKLDTLISQHGGGGA